MRADHGGAAAINVNVEFIVNVRANDDLTDPHIWTVDIDDALAHIDAAAALRLLRAAIDRELDDSPAAGDRELRRADPGGVRPEDHDEYVALLAAVRAGLDDLERSVAARHGS